MSILDEVGLGDCGKKKYRNFSLGMKQKLEIAAALMEKPKLILLDEPTNALDEKSVRDLRSILAKRREEVAEIPLYDIYFEQEDYCNGLAPEVFFGMGNETECVALTENEAKEVTLGYLIFEKQFKAAVSAKNKVENVTCSHPMGDLSKQNRHEKV